MSKTIVKKTKKKDLQRADELMSAYAQMTRDKAEIMATVNEKLAPIIESMKEAEAELIAIGERNRDKFDQKKNLVFDEGYLHISDTTSIVPGKEFSMKKFMAKFPDYVDIKFKVAPLKKAFLDGDARKPFQKMDIDVKQTEVMQVKVAV